eukprot:1274928-Rhodomonas_salina.2
MAQRSKRQRPAEQSTVKSDRTTSKVQQSGQLSRDQRSNLVKCQRSKLIQGQRSNLIQGQMRSKVKGQWSNLVAKVEAGVEGAEAFGARRLEAEHFDQPV